jgi:hypothetical protein
MFWVRRGQRIEAGSGDCKSSLQLLLANWCLCNRGAWLIRFTFSDALTVRVDGPCLGSWRALGGAV